MARKATVVPINTRPPWQDAIQTFLWHKSAQGTSERTRKDYLSHVERFFNAFPHAWENQEQLKRSLWEFMGKECSNNYFNLKREYLGSFMAWCLAQGYIQANPLADIRKKKPGSRIVDIDPDTIKQLLKSVNQSTFAGLRDYGILLVQLDTAARPSEVLSLLPTDISFHTLEITIRESVAKTRTQRILPISPQTAKAISSILAARHPAWSSTVPVFCSADGVPLRSDQWCNRLQAHSRKLARPITPYQLRHFSALMFLRSGGNVFGLQRLMGHTDLTMTRKYISLTNNDLRQQHSTASPLNVLLPQRHRVRKVK